MDVYCSVLDRFTCIELRETLGTDDIITFLQLNGLRLYRRISRKGENDWVKMHGR